MSALWVHVETRYDLVTAYLRGNAGARNADTLDRAVRSLLVAAPRRLIVDLSGITFISSTGVVLLARLQRGVEAGGGTFVLANVPARIGDVIRRCRVGDLLPMAEEFARAG